MTRPLNNLQPQWSSLGSNPTNFIVPDSSHLQYGWAYQEQPPFQYMNWVHNTTYNWVNYLDKQVNQFAPQESSPQALTITLNAGTLLINGAYVNHAIQTSSPTTAPISNPRIDLYTIDYTGTLQFYIGTEAGSPVPPDLPVNEIGIAYVAMSVSQTIIINANITDLRSSINSGIKTSGSAKSVCRVWTDAGQTLSTTAIIQLNQATFDINSEFDLSAYTFKPKTAGYYRISAQLTITTPTGAGPTAFDLFLYKNGSPYSQRLTDPITSADNDISINISDIILMNGSTDTVQLFGFSTFTASPVSTDSLSTFFTAELISN